MGINSGLDSPSLHSKGRERWLNSGSILEVEPIGFADQLDGKQEEEKSRMVPWLWPEPQKGSVALN